MSETLLLPFTYSKPAKEGYYLCRRGFPQAHFQIVRISQENNRLCYYSPLVVEFLDRMEDKSLWSQELDPLMLEGLELPKAPSEKHLSKLLSGKNK